MYNTSHDNLEYVYYAACSHHIIGLSSPAVAIATIYTTTLTIVPPLALLFFYAKGYREVVVAERNVKAENQASRVVARMGLTVLGFYCVTILPWSGSALYILIEGASTFPIVRAAVHLLGPQHLRNVLCYSM